MGDPSLLLTDFTLYKVSLARNPRVNVCIVAAVCIWNCNPQSSFSWCLQMRGMWQSADLAYLEEARHWAPSPLTKARYPAEGGDWKGKERVWFLLSTCLFLAKAPVTQIDGCVSHVGPICLPAVQLWLNPLKKLWPTDQLSAGNGCVQCENSGAAAFREDNGSPLILPSYKGEETVSPWMVMLGRKPLFSPESGWGIGFAVGWSHHFGWGPQVPGHFLLPLEYQLGLRFWSCFGSLGESVDLPGVGDKVSQVKRVTSEFEIPIPSVIPLSCDKLRSVNSTVNNNGGSKNQARIFWPSTLHVC